MCRTATPAVHVEDRGYQFADGVYEVCEVRGGPLVDERRHMERLERSLRELRIAMPMPRNALGVVLRETVRATACTTASSTCRSRAASRGAITRSRRPARAPSVVVTARNMDFATNEALAAEGIAVISRAGQPLGAGGHQVGRRCCRTCSPSRRRARQGAKEAWFVDAEGFVTEGSSSNAWIVTRDGAVVTRPGRPRHPARASPARWCWR